MRFRRSASKAGFAGAIPNGWTRLMIVNAKRKMAAVAPQKLRRGNGTTGPRSGAGESGLHGVFRRRSDQPAQGALERAIGPRKHSYARRPVALTADKDESCCGAMKARGLKHGGSRTSSACAGCKTVAAAERPI